MSEQRMAIPFAKISQWSRRRWMMAGVCTLIAACVGVLVVPQLWAANHYRLGLSALDHYHSADARDHFQACLKVWKNSIPTKIYLSRAYRRLGDYSEARKQIKECQSLLKGTRADVALEDALLRTTMGELGQFETSLRSRMEREPENAPLILEALAEGYARMHRMLECMTCLSQWLDFEPENPQAYYLRGRASQQIPTFEKAAADYRKVLELDPERVDARERLATCLVEISRFEEALGHLEHLQKLRPNDADLLVRVARCQNGLGQVKRARQILESVIAEHPEHGRALLLLGRIIMSNSQPEEAEEWLRRAAKLLPHDYQAQWQLYDCLKRQENKTAESQAQLAVAEALRDLSVRQSEISRQLAVRPHDASLHFELGMLLVKLGDKEMGARWLSSALNEKLNYPEARDALISLLKEMGRDEEANDLRQ
jgi:tetratricopeptide (TPR) repeat protein